MKNTRRTWPTEPTNQNSHRFTETNVTSKGPARVYTRYFEYMLWWLAWCFYGKPSIVRTVFCLWLFCLNLGHFSSYFAALFSLNIRTLALSYFILVDHVCCLLEACLFLKRNRVGVSLGEGRLWRAERSGGRENCSGCVIWAIHLFSIKNTFTLTFSILNTIR